MCTYNTLYISIQPYIIIQSYIMQYMHNISHFTHRELCAHHHYRYIMHAHGGRRCIRMIGIYYLIWIAILSNH